MLTKVENSTWMLEEEAKEIYYDKWFLFLCPDISKETYHQDTSLIQVLYVWDKNSEGLLLPKEVIDLDDIGISEGPEAGGKIQIGAIIYET